MPSQFLGLDDPYQAWCLNEAVYRFGNHYDYRLALAEVEGSTPQEKIAFKRQVFKEMLDIPDEILQANGIDLPPSGGVVFGNEDEVVAKPTRGRFADPGAMVFGAGSDKEVRRTSQGD